ncbi:ABC transporter substrate-binding protein [Micromonospora sp. HM5-17]|jgi:iron complex transport system substrate-binding protein|uniref:ABC transporter substrate-binding protein n=1 Tax=Micromonospora sp. HM5-17 TaxID=2487710 RepID=UPI000F4A6CBA|nr:ABC transporter substrate-binding protein [Micromonospora sp. HM5-17]ROT34038.1 ABC transporter substrate-binding protein [Micromonospora sp. HM5-17]
MTRSPQLTRRNVLRAAGALGLGALLSACGADEGGSGGAKAAGDGAWSFTDDRGQTVTTPGRPQRVVAFVGTAAALYDFGVTDQIVGVFGPTTRPDGSPDVQAGNLDVSKVTIVGNTWGEFNLEKYASLRPDLLVTHQYEEGSLWYVPDESKDKIAPLAPSLALAASRAPLDKVIARHADLAAALGADLTAPRVVEAKARFEAAAESIRQAVAANPGLRVLACSAAADLFYASNPRVNSDILYYTSLGVDVIVPDKLDNLGYFESLSWENADKYPADILLLDNRSSTLQPKDLTNKPTWNQLPAVRANQVVGWNSEPLFSYASSAAALETLATAIRNAKKVI